MGSTRVGYSTPKKQLDLKEFLSHPGKKSNRQPFNFRSAQSTKVEEVVEAAPAETEAPAKAD